MPRSLRPQLANTWQLVWNEGLPQAPIFRESADYRCFIKLLSEISDVFHVKIHAYALLPQSCQVVLYTEHANLSPAMRSLFGNYSRHINKTYKRQGPLFRGRFYSLIFEPKEALLDMVKSVHQHALQGQTATDLVNYEWCSHRWYTNPYSAPEWLDVNTALAHFSKTQSLAVKKYNKFMLGKSVCAASGQDGLCGPVDLAQGRQSGQVEQKKRNNLTPDILMNSVAHAYNTTHWAIRNTGSGRKNMPRLVTMYCLRNLMGFSLKEIVDVTQARDTNMVAQTLYRARRVIKEDKKALALVGEIRRMR